MNCPNCSTGAVKTPWIPPTGYDPRLVEYHCPLCRLKFYVTSRRRFDEEALEEKKATTGSG